MEQSSPRGAEPQSGRSFLPCKAHWLLLAPTRSMDQRASPSARLKARAHTPPALSCAQQQGQCRNNDVHTCLPSKGFFGKPHTFLIACPPNSLRSEDSSLSAKESSSRER